MLNLDTRQSKLFLGLTTLIVLLAGFNIYREFFSNESVTIAEQDMQIQFPSNVEQNVVSDKPIQNENAELSDERSYIKVYLAGQIKNPGVIEIEEGSRLSDAVELAGGLLDDADLLRVNLALRVKDEGMYVIPKIGERLPAMPEGTSTGQQITGDNVKVNINTADQSSLEGLPGIGPSRARAIIEYRERFGLFDAIEELKDVSGIGDKIFEGLKDSVTVN